MRALVLLWLVPVAGFWTWHLMSAGGVLFPREFHDRVFDLYGSVLGVDPASIPDLLLNAFMVDGSILVAIVAIRKRRPILAAIRAAVARGRAANL